jgi:hypothetical protein
MNVIFWEIFNENQVADLMHLKYDGSLIVHCDLLDSQIIINCFKNIIFVGDVDVDTIYCGGNLVAKKSFTVKKLKCGGVCLLVTPLQYGQV